MRRDLQDVIPKILFLREHDTYAARVAQAGRKLALETAGDPRCVSEVWAAALRVLARHQNESVWGVADHDKVPWPDISAAETGLTYEGGKGGAVVRCFKK